MDVLDGSRATAERLKAWALETGFDRAGVARLTLQPHGPAFVHWLARGDQAGMGAMAPTIIVRRRSGGW